MSEIAILGYGTVGSGVAELFDDNRENIIKKNGEGHIGKIYPRRQGFSRKQI